MVFSLFGRRDKSDSRKSKAGDSQSLLDPTLRGQSDASGVDRQREAARQTAEKIDRIESEMIATVRAKSVAAAAPSPIRAPAAPANRAAPAPNRLPEVAPARLSSVVSSVPSSPRPAAASALESRAPQAERADLDFGSPGSASAPTYGSALSDAGDAGGILVSGSSLSADLEEAAILFANDQGSAALATLDASLARGELGDSTRLGWLMRFDVLQASGHRADFEAKALEFAARFETSPPCWYEPKIEPVVTRRVVSATVVSFAARLDAEVQRSIDQVQKAGLQKRPIVADFSSVAAVEPSGAVLTTRLIETFLRANRELGVKGVDRLFAAARAAIEPGRRDADPACWLLALVALRLQGEQQAFEDLSIEYCVTYEVSPPSWEPVGPRLTLLGADGAAPASDPAAGGAAPAPAAALADPAGQSTSIEGSALVLRGQVSGRMVTELGLLRAYAADRSEVVIDARGLKRLDFVAAGELLNEVVVLRSAGKPVLIIEPSFIVEALLVVMGIDELAEIRRRKV